MDSHRPDFEGLLAQVATALRTRNVGFMVIGGQAVLLHGEPRLTQDIDITLGATPDRLADILAACNDARLEPLPQDVQNFVQSTYVLPAESQTGIRVDFIFSSTSYEATAIGRAQPVFIGGVKVMFASAEDLIIHKLFAGRPRDLEDADGVVRRKRDELDWEYMNRWTTELGSVPGREFLTQQLRELRGN